MKALFLLQFSLKRIKKCLKKCYSQHPFALEISTIMITEALIGPSRKDLFLCKFLVLLLVVSPLFISSIVLLPCT